MIIWPELREYQTDVTNRTRKAAAACKRPVRVILQASTGAGKSVMGMDLILRCYEKGKRALFIVSGRALVNQFERHLIMSGVPHGIIMAGRGQNLDAPVQIASKETLAARLIRREAMQLPLADLIVVDEAHESTANEFVQLLDRYSQSVVIGLTATPALGNGKGLGHVWNGMEKAISTQALVEQGFLVPCRVFAPYTPDLKGVKLDANGDYDRKQVARRMDKPKLVGDVLQNWRKYADGRRTVIFGCTIAHAKHICDEFNQAGIKFRHIDEKTNDDEREEIFGLIKDGKCMGFTNVSVARRGLDLPCLEAACVVRPTRSLVLWLQMIGRIRRPCKETGKQSCIIIDHAGACDYHCLPDDEIDWNLDNEKKIGEWLEDAKKEGKVPKQTMCPKCYCMFTGSARCPNCGHTVEQQRHTKPIDHADGVLVERTQQAVASLEDMQRWWNRCIGVAANRSQKMFVCVGMFKQKYKRLPWAVPGLKNVPAPGPLWQSRADHLFPSFKKVKVS